jgi:site-specific recombinase XerC
VMRVAGDSAQGVRLRGIVVVLWRAGLRISEALGLNEADLDPNRGSVAAAGQHHEVRVWVHRAHPWPPSPRMHRWFRVAYAPVRKASISAANSVWCWNRKPWAESG